LSSADRLRQGRDARRSASMALELRSAHVDHPDRRLTGSIGRACGIASRHT
jgi:hypothetical protein